MQSYARLLGALGDPERRGDAWIRQFVASWVPAGVAALERSIDPTVRRSDPTSEAHRDDPTNAILARIPWASEALPPQLDLWGRERRTEGGFWNMIAPAIGSTAVDSPIDRWMSDARLTLQPIERTQPFTVGGQQINISLTQEQHNRIIRLAGNELKVFPGPGNERLGTYDYLNAVVQERVPTPGGMAWSRASDERRQLIVRQVVTAARQAARQTLLSDDTALRGLIEDQARARGTALMEPRAAADVPQPSSTAPEMR